MYYSKQKWNHDKCQFKCKELYDLISCKKVTKLILEHVIVNVIKHIKLVSI